MIRKILGLTQEELASQAGLARSSVQKIEGGDFSPSEETLSALLAPLGMVLEAAPAALDLEGLHSLGVPLSPLLEAGPARPAAQPSFALLQREFRKAAIGYARLNEREKEAFLACALALRAHFPSIWRRHFSAPAFAPFARDVDLTRAGRLLKLRRIALDRLCSYL